jgi:catalase
LITDGVDSALLNDLKKALVKEGATLEFVAPTIAGVKSSDGSLIEANQKIDGGPSVLYDAVAVLITKQGCEQLASIPAARDFVADAFAHSKFIAYSGAAKQLLLDVIGVDQLDDGCIELGESENAAEFVHQCRQLRFWERSTNS